MASLGFDRCLTQSLVDAWNRNDEPFIREPLTLPTNLTNITYKGVSMPLKVGTCASWAAGYTLTASIIDILLREVLGIQTSLVCTFGAQHAIRMVGGCSNPFDVYGNCTTSSGDPELDPPLAMILGETWITSPEAWETASSLVNILGQIGYYYEDGVYVKEELADAALANNVMLAWWESYVAPTNYSPGARAEPSEWFDDYTTVTDDIRNYSGRIGVQEEPACGLDVVVLERDLLPNGFNCSEGWYFTPHCAADKSKCVPVVLMMYGHMGLNFIRHAEEFGYRYAITWFNWPHSLDWGVQSDKRFLLFCSSMLTVCQERNLKMVWAGKHHPQYRQNFISSLYKTTWPKLQTVQPKAYNLLNRMIIDEEDHTPGTSVVATNLRANMSESAAFGGAACDWVKAHREDWIKWVDRVCTPGFEFRRFSGRCEMCVPGTYSPDGEPCDECVDGREALDYGQDRCKPCPGGEWREGSATACSACPAGTSRDPASDSHG